MQNSKRRDHRPRVQSLQTWAYVLVLLLGPAVILNGQVNLSREYIRLSGKVIAIENTGTGTPPGGGTNVRVDVWPGSSSLGLNQQLQFQAAVTGSPNTAVTWTRTPGYGTITPAGLYTAPSTVSNGQSVVVTATSLADPTKSASANVTFYSPQVAGDYPILGSFVHFYRNLTLPLWAKEFDEMKQIGMNTAVVLSIGALKPNAQDPNGYSLSGNGLLYPSAYVTPAEQPVEDRLETILTLADQRGAKVYLGSLQTFEAWFNGTEFAALRDWNRKVAQEVLTRYGSHPSLEGWYFTQEVWLNWVKYYNDLSGTYYGTTLIKDFVTDMEALDPTKPVAAAVVFKKDGYGSMPGLSPAQLQSVSTQFLQTTRLQVFMPQDGIGAGDGAPSVEELPSYFQAMRAAADGTGRAILWSTVETFTAVPNVSNDRFPPATALRIQSQVNAVRPYVTGYVNWIFGNDMSPQATYYPVEASKLNRDYRARFRPAAVTDLRLFPALLYSSLTFASPYYPDSGTELADGQGGGYNGYTFTDWVGYPIESSAGQVVVVSDLGSAQQIRQVRVLSLSMANSGIYHPRSRLN
jgi:hypothetical protein